MSACRWHLKPWVQMRPGVLVEEGPQSSSPISKFRGQGEKEEPAQEMEQEQAGREESWGGRCLRSQGQESHILWSCFSLCPGVPVGGGQKWVGEGRRGGVRQRKHLGKEMRCLPDSVRALTLGLRPCPCFGAVSWAER